MDCGCTTNVNTLSEDPVPMVCPTIVHEEVCVQGTVTITPRVESGESRSFCIGDPMIGKCEGKLEKTCVFTVSQKICVQIPLTFSAKAEAKEDGIVCSEAKTGECKRDTEPPK